MASRNSMLEKILEDFPNCNNQSSNQVKNETLNRDSNDLFNSSSIFSPLDHSKSYIHNNNSNPASQMNFTTGINQITSFNNRMNSHLNLPNTTSFFNNDQPYPSNLFSNHSTPSIDRNKMNNLNLQLIKSQNHPKNEIMEPIDLNSSKGKFGWSTCTIVGKEIPLPIILRKDEKLVPVRIVESKIIGLYSNDLPWSVFSCINIKSFFITDIEAKLLNEINNLHCDNYYGSERFSSKDIVVRLNDVQTLQTFLETTKKVFIQGLDSCDFLGFVKISGIASVIPYIVKESTKLNCIQEIGLHKSSITSSLSNLSIKKPIVDLKDQTDSSSLLIPDEFKELKSDDLNCFLMNGDDNLNAIKMGNSTNRAMNENNVVNFNGTNIESNFNDNFNNQIASPSLYIDQNSLEELDHNINNNLMNLVDNMDHNLNSFETDQFNSQLDEVPQCKTNFTSNDQMDTTPHSKKFVPCSLIEDLSLIGKADKIELNEWDCSYLKMICIYAGYENMTKSLTTLSKSLADASNNGSTSMDDNSSFLKLICLNDLKCDAVHFKPVAIKECLSNSSFELSPTHQFNQAITNQPHQHSVINDYLTASNVQSTSNLNQNDKESIHQFNQLLSTIKKTSELHRHLRKLNTTNNNHQTTKEAHNSAFVDDSFIRISPNNCYVNSNLIGQTPSNSTTSLNIHLGDGCNASNLNDNSLNSNANPYQSTSNFQYNSRSHPNNYTGNHSRLNSHQPIAHQPTISGLQQSTATKSNYHLNSNAGSNNFTVSSNNPTNKSNHLFGSSIIDELAKNFQPNGTTVGLNSHNSTINNRNAPNNYDCNPINSNQSNLATSSNFNFDSLTNNNIVNSSDLTSNRINNLSSMMNLGLSNSFHNSFQSTTVRENALHTISTVIFSNVQLKSINLKHSSPSQALLLSEIHQKLFSGIDLVTLKFVLESSFNLKFHHFSSLHKQAFNNHGLYPSQDDKLILLDDLRKCLPQIRQCIANIMII